MRVLKSRYVWAGVLASFAANLISAPAMAEDRDGPEAPPRTVLERAPQSERDPNGTGSSSFFLLDEKAPEIDQEDVFRRWARIQLNDPDSVKALRMGPVFKAYASLIPPIQDWMMCLEFNATGGQGGYTGLTQFLFVLRDSDDDGRWNVVRVDDRGRGTWREHCIPFMKEGQQ